MTTGCQAVANYFGHHQELDIERLFHVAFMCAFEYVNREVVQRDLDDYFANTRLPGYVFNYVKPRH